MHGTFRKFGLIALSLLSFLGAAFARSNSGFNVNPEEQGNQSSQNSAKSEDYRLRSGDVLNISFFYNPELNDRVEIGPDGKISLRFVHEIQAAGLTQAELRKILTSQYARILKEPEVAVIVATYSGQKIYVGGEVTIPGLQPLDAGTNVLEAVMRAGGPLRTARTSNVILIRKGPDNQATYTIVDLGKTLNNKGTDTGPLLQPFDVVFIPKSRIAKANQFVDQYIKQLLPLSLVGGFNWLRQDLSSF